MKSYAIDLRKSYSRDFVHELLDEQRLDVDASGIARVALENGIDELTEKQISRLNAAIYEAGVRRIVCRRCNDLIPLAELLAATDEHCAYCQNQEWKDAKLVASTKPQT